MNWGGELVWTEEREREARGEGKGKEGEKEGRKGVGYSISEALASLRGGFCIVYGSE